LCYESQRNSLESIAYVSGVVYNTPYTTTKGIRCHHELKVTLEH